MPTIKASIDPSRFLLTDYTVVNFTNTRVDFINQNASDGDGAVVTIFGDFERTAGVISGSISSMELDRDWDFGRRVLRFGDEPVFVEDLAALQKSGTIGVQLLFAGNDEITGFNKGYGGDDILHTRTISKFDGGVGSDTLVFDTRVALDLNRDGHNFRSIEAYRGSGFDDDLRGTFGADNLSGGAGDDLLVGRIGNDILDGGSGFDRLIGSTGIDIMTGGSGGDTFIFERVTDSTRAQADRITDFNRAHDVIDLQIIDANTLRSGNQAFTFIGTEKFHGIAGELRFAQSGDKTVITGDVNGDKVVDFGLYLDQFIKLTSNDFIL